MSARVITEGYGDFVGFGTLKVHSIAISQRDSEPMSAFVEQEYTSRMDALSPQDRIARCAAMLKWTRDLLARQIVSERGEMPTDRLKWEVAKRMYGADPAARAIIDQRLDDVSR